jgi:hypothetical protein
MNMKLNIEHIKKTLYVGALGEDFAKFCLDTANKAIEIAIAEYQESEYITAAQPEPVATIKLDGRMVTPEQAAAERDAKKETHELWYRSDRVDWCIWRLKQWNTVEDHNEQYELRPKQPTWTGSRDDVIALLKEIELL